MLAILSPSKTLDFETPASTKKYTQPAFLDDTKTLVKTLRALRERDIAKLMDISDKLASLNFARYQNFSPPFSEKNAKQALLAFKGDVYAPMQVAKYTEKEFAFAQEHVRILSGLYGLLRPLDLMQPYRLEMGTALKNPKGKDLYAFWGEKITELLNTELKKQKNKVLINLASEEYFKAVKPKALQGKLVNIVFKQKHNGKLKIIGLFAKRARGLMADYIITQKITKPADILTFDLEGYAYNKPLSSENDWVFVK